MKRFSTNRFNLRILLPTFLLFICLVYFVGNTQGQAIGDFGSIASGDWTATSTWAQWDGSGYNTAATTYPGEVGETTGAVTIQSGHIVFIDGPFNAQDEFLTDPMGTVTIEPGAKLELISGSQYKHFYLETMELNIVSSPSTGILELDQKAVLHLPENAVIFAGKDIYDDYGIVGQRITVEFI